jgi:hypothetical protein
MLFLQSSVVSRLTTILPFVWFTPEEREALAAEAIEELAEPLLGSRPTSDIFASIISGSLTGLGANEDARAIRRAVSNHLLDVGDFD